MLKRAYDIASSFREYLILAALLVVSVALLTVNDSPQIRVLRSLTIQSLGLLQETFNFIPDYFSLRSENTMLRGLNLKLSEEVSLLREAQLENIRLRQMLGLRERSSYPSVPARIVGKTLQLMRNTITLDVGQDRGVREQMPIVTGLGLVGKITAASGSYSVGQILFNRRMRVSAKIQRSRVDGIVEWDGGTTLTLKNVAKTLDVQPGDVVVTSDYSSLYPEGIRIGTVVSAAQIPGSLFQRVEVAPSVDFATIEEVFVITRQPDTSRVRLERERGRF
jgi:rod shape-determining protein MreC